MVGAGAAAFSIFLGDGGIDTVVGLAWLLLVLAVPAWLVAVPAISDRRGATAAMRRVCIVLLGGTAAVFVVVAHLSGVLRS